MVQRGSAGVAEAGGDAVDGGGDGAVELGGDGLAGGDGGALAADQLDLDERHGIDVGVAQADGIAEDGVGLEQRGLLGDGEDHAAGEFELGLEGGEDTVAQGLVLDQAGVEAGDGEVGLGEGQLDVADDVEEEREVAGHGLELGEVGGFGLDFAILRPTPNRDWAPFSCGRLRYRRRNAGVLDSLRCSG